MSPSPRGEGDGGGARPSRLWRRARASLIPLIILLALTLPHLDQGDFRTDTGWYAAIGLSSVRHWAQAASLGDLLTLHAEPGKPFFNKPPLALWIHGVFMHLFGVSLVAARLPTILAAAACVLTTVAITRRFATRTQAMAAGIALALTIEFFRRTKEISLDLWQLVFMLAAVLCVCGLVRERRATSRPIRAAIASGACIGLALLCKPLVPFLASAIIVGWLVTHRRVGVGWIFAHLAAAIAVAAPWYVVMTTTHGDAFLTRHFVGEVAERAAGTLTTGQNAVTGGGNEPAWFYLQLIAQTYWPWVATCLLAAIALLRAELTGRRRALALFALAWFGAWLVLLSIFPDRRPRYALVLWPAGAILSGLWLGLRAARPVRPLIRIMAVLGAPVAVVAGIVFALLPVQVQKPPAAQWPALFGWMRQEQVSQLWQGAFSGPSGARLYLEFGAWPIQTQDRALAVILQPPVGALLVYHRRDGHTPGPREEVVFHEGDLTVTRLREAPWEPVRTPDPGE